MKQPHKHAELIKAWADGAEIEWFAVDEWKYVSEPAWSPIVKYRIKPEPKPDVVRYGYASLRAGNSEYGKGDNIRLTFDGETGKLKKAEVLECN